MLDRFQRLRQEALNRFYRYGEPALAIGSSAIAEPVSGLAGIGSLLSGKSASDAALAIAQAQAAMTYQPRTAQGMQGLQSFQQVMQPVGEVIQGASQNLGDKAYSATGSPLAGAIGYSLPTAMLEGLGLKGLNIARKPVNAADLYSARMGAGAVGDGGNIKAYHGTNSVFNKFSEYRPAFFSKDKGYASQYGDKLMEVELDVKNPLDTATDERARELYNTKFLNDPLGAGAKKLEAGERIPANDADNFWAYIASEAEIDKSIPYDGIIVSEGRMSDIGFQPDAEYSIVPFSVGQIKILDEANKKSSKKPPKK